MSEHVIVGELQSMMCEYHGCKLPAVTYFRTTKKWCCQHNSCRCPGVRQKTRITNLEKYGMDNPSKSESIKEKRFESYKSVDWEEVKKKRRQTCISKYGVENVSQILSIQEKRNNTFLEKYNGHPFADPELILQRKQIMLERYGVNNYGKTQEHKDSLTEYYNSLSNEIIDEKIHRILQTKFKLGIITDPLLKSEFERYYIDVRNLSDRNYKKFKSIINPDNFSRGRTLYHLDHIFSIKDAFEHNVPVEVVSHRSNLRMLKYDENIVKGGLSDKSLIDLFEDFYRNA